MNFTKQKNTIYRNLGEELVQLMKTSKAILAGGALTSIFSGKEINDYDLYFRNKEDLILFVRNAFLDEDNIEDEDDFVEMAAYSLICTSQTDRSITFSVPNNNLKIQLIHFDYFENVSDIFKSYDFTINMCAFDFVHEQFIMEENFLIDIAQRRLTFNTGTKYPIMSTLRVSKYCDRGYTISKKEMFKIGLAISSLNITSWDELEDQLSGFYGVDVSQMFDRTKEFSIDTAVEMLDQVEELPESVRLPNPNLRQVLFNIDGDKTKTQRMFYKPVNRIDAENNLAHTMHVNNEPAWELGVGRDVERLEVFATHDEADTYLNRYWKNGVSGVMVIVLEDGRVDMGPNGLILTGAVKPYGFMIN